MYSIVFIMSPMDSSYNFKEAKQLLHREHGNDLSIDFMDSYKIDSGKEDYDKCMKLIESSDMIFIIMHGGLTHFKSFYSILDRFEGKKKFFIHSGFEDENRIMLQRSGISQMEYAEILKYVSSGSINNCKNLIKYLAAVYGGMKIEYNYPDTLKWEGIYYPGDNIDDFRGYLDNGKKSGKPVIGILFYSKYIHDNDMEHIDAMIREVESLGAYPAAVYSSSASDLSIGCKGFRWVVENIFKMDGISQVNAIINTMAYSQSILSNAGDGSKVVDKSIFEDIDVPVIQAMATYQSYEDWKSSLRGLDAMSFTSSVYYPEFDGQIIFSTVAYCELVKDDIGEKRIHKPIFERINRVCRLACNWAKLSKKLNSEKKVAILFHNMPPRNDMIGCAFGLDTPQSVHLMVKALKEAGVYTEYEFENGDEIINRIINGVSNDTRWLPAEKALEKSVDIISGDLYRSWFYKLSQTVQDQLIRDWSDPPGEYMVHEDKLPVPGIINGNIFIGLQPPRGYEEKAEEVYHSTDIVPPHQYIAFYKWIRNSFKADVIVHVGTHGTLEWLPGKEIGLSESCYPDIAIDDIPHLYPYNITVIGEGIQAKRRSHAVILDHLIPSLMMSGAYEEMEEIDELIKQYYQARQLDRGKLEHIKGKIIEIAIKNDYHTDLNITKVQMETDFEKFIELLHSWIEEIKNTLIKDGLHIFGTAPAGERLENLICALLRLPNVNVPSLMNGTCKAMGYDYESLKDMPHETDHRGRTNFMVIEKMEKISRQIMRDFITHGFDESKIDELLSKYFNDRDKEKTDDIRETLHFTAQVVRLKLESTTDEMKYLTAGIEGRFIPPGGGGAPTRGNVRILPTGRNFYSIDPASVPTRASWKVGKQLGDKMIERYTKDEGKLPEAVAIVVYAGETMKTCGDDIAEILYLMGIKPKWMENSDKVIGLEVIPIEELKRPRIDVTLRVSGLFRDTFPNIIEMIEDAVNLAAGLDEGEDDNYIRRNFIREVNNLVENGTDAETAQEEAGMRIFSDPPGTYGAGVDKLINSKNWDDYEDLGNVYTLWGGYAYGKRIHGRRVTEVFARRLSQAQISIKNESSMEIDMLESDDFYNYHGGLIAAIRAKSGEKPRSYCGNTADPSRVKMNDAREEAAKIMRSRILNPKWFEGLRPHGYKGAQEISAMVDFVFGWDATSDIIEDWMYEKISENYLFNNERREWIKSVNPWAIHNMVERLLEAQQRGMWNAKEESLKKLRNLYISIEGDLEERM